MGNAKEFSPPWDIQYSHRKYIRTQMLLYFIQNIEGHFSNTTFLQCSIVPHIFY